MGMLKPGEFRITDKAIRKWDLPKGAAILDIGCGTGETVEYLENEWGYKAVGIDNLLTMIDEGLARNPGLNIKFGDGEFLEDYESYSFDGVMMECVLSVTDKPDEVLHETYCVLKKGGRLFISDLYVREPDPSLIEAVRIEADRQRSIGHGDECSSGCAEEHQKRFVDFRSCGRFLIDPLIAQIREIGFSNILIEDCTDELDTYAAEKMMKDGTLEGCFCEGAINPADKHKTGYFMLTAEKPQ